MLLPQVLGNHAPSQGSTHRHRLQKSHLCCFRKCFAHCVHLRCNFHLCQSIMKKSATSNFQWNTTKKALIQFGTLYFTYSASPIFQVTFNLLHFHDYNSEFVIITQLRRYHRFSTPCELRHHYNCVGYWTTWSEPGIEVDSRLRLTGRATTCFYVQITNAKACTTIGIR